jgi:ankyrin repeat/BTB/POZ domain-containing protein 2
MGNARMSSECVTSAVIMFTVDCLQKLNSVNENGLSPLMLAVLLHDEACVYSLLDAGADPDIETPPYGTLGCPGVNAETQHWTALTYAALQGTCSIARLLLERGAHVEGGARLSEDRCTQTPLQVCCLLKIF